MDRCFWLRKRLIKSLLFPAFALLSNRLIWLSNQPVYGVMAIALVAFATRFWNLGGTADIVFDEVYYPKFAQNYLLGQPLFDAHPPLAK